MLGDSVPLMQMEEKTGMLIKMKKFLGIGG